MAGSARRAEPAPRLRGGWNGAAPGHHARPGPGACAAPRKERGLRPRIRKGLLPPTIPAEEGLDFDRLARRFHIAVAHIRNSVFKKVFRAATHGGVLTQEILEEAGAEEAAPMSTGRVKAPGFVSA